MGAGPVQAVSVRDPEGQAEWLEQLAADPLVARRNAPTRRKLLALARELCYRANWETFEAWPTWPRLMAASGWARSTMAGWLRELRLRGWLTTVEQGSTPQFRPMARADVEGNRAAVYGLRIPINADILNTTSSSAVTSAVEETWTPTHSFDLDQKSWVSGSSRARQIFHSLTSTRAAKQEIEALRARIDEKQVLDWTFRVPTTPGEMLAAAAQLRREHPILARLSPRAVRAEARPYWAAGWCNVDLVHALRYRPGAHTALPTMRAEAIWHPARWVRARLGAWRGPRGRVLPGHTDHQAARAAIRRRHGRGALAALPDQARILTAADIRAHGHRRRPAAAETHARGRRRALMLTRMTPRDQEQAATPEVAAAGAAACRRQLERAREQHRAEQRQNADQQRKQLVARAHLYGHGPHTPTRRPEQAYEPSSEEVYRRARERVAADRRSSGQARGRPAAAPSWA